ncbi:hypothetical protein DOS68_03620 [Staphylococcus felis]|uniref:hypothetical protein n=1 Tax=Staphylococcus felis TaxID=46127 RepID=UPI000E2892AF|nr:hypothetical protein [Staphylococcus felis]REH91388.1 hypothetical protein DOS68_03620 [Staphylococcus felis]
MAKLKKTVIFASSLAVVLSLTACDNNNKASDDNKKENKTSRQSQSQTKDSHSKNKNMKIANVEQLPEKKKLALAFFADDADQYTLTKDEALTGIFSTKYGNTEEKKQLYKLVLVKANHVSNAPQDMNFYKVVPAKGSFESIIGVSKDKIYIGGTQGVLDYKELQDAGQIYNLEDLYNQNKSYHSLTELADKIQITDKDPMHDDKTRQEFEANENPTTNTHMRTQVYHMIEQLDEKPIDTQKYLVDNVQMTESGKWYVHYRNKNAEIVGTYTTKGENVVKKDSDGKIIKEKHIIPNR